MPCACKKNKQGAFCQNCTQGMTNTTQWVDCVYWSARQDETPIVNGQYVRYTNGSVRTKVGTTCDHYTKPE